MKRSPMRRAAKKPKRPLPLVPKALGKSAVDKRAHWYSKAHLELVRAQPCLVSRYIGPEVVAHHPRELFDRSMGKRISDFLAVPMRHNLHDPATPGSLHHAGNALAWWRDHGPPTHIGDGIFSGSPLYWLRGFLMRHYKPGQNRGADEALALVIHRIRATH